MNISVFGLGYVGVVTAACLAKNGHSVFGVDISESKTNLINSGQTPIIEDDIGELIKNATDSKKLIALNDATEAVSQTEMAIICVGTPSKQNGALENKYIENVIGQIGDAIRDRNSKYLVVVRSTVVPGTVSSLVIPTLEERSGKKVGEGFDVLFHPEFLRESTSVYDFYNPPKIVIGEIHAGASDPLMSLYNGIDAPRIVTTIKDAEMVKYCDNLFHAVKITFANEIGQFCQSHNINSQNVMDIFCQDTKLNISDKYLRPGFAFGGSCLPKDLRAFLSEARNQNLNLPMLENVLSSNQSQIERALRQILEINVSKIGIYGLSFKAGTDDLRESPLVELTERLLGKGKSILCYDDKVQEARLVGGNRSFVKQHLPHLAELLKSNLQDLSDCEAIIVGHSVDRSIIDNWLNSEIKVFDLSSSNLDIENPGFQSIV